LFRSFGSPKFFFWSKLSGFIFFHNKETHVIYCKILSIFYTKEGVFPLSLLGFLIHDGIFDLIMIAILLHHCLPLIKWHKRKNEFANFPKKKSNKNCVDSCTSKSTCEIKLFDLIKLLVVWTSYRLV
jgi:hypothetical protein